LITSVYIKQHHSIRCFDSGDSWTILSPIEESIKRKIEAIGVPLKDWKVRINYGIKTGFNEAFIINRLKRDELISADPKSAEIIRPILRGRDIKRYSHSFSDWWLINTHNGFRDKKIPPIDIKNYPAIKEHLDRFLPHLVKRQDQGDTPYNLRSCAYMDDFSKQKIAWGNLCLHAQYAFIEDNYFVNNPANIIVPGDKYLLAVLNSKIADFYIKKLGVARNGGFFEYKPMFIEKLPIPLLKSNTRNKLVAIVDDILTLRKQNVPSNHLEQKINVMLCDIVGLDEKEKNILLEN
jgi:hypothetical protein